MRVYVDPACPLRVNCLPRWKTVNNVNLQSQATWDYITVFTKLFLVLLMFGIGSALRCVARRATGFSSKVVGVNFHT